MRPVHLADIEVAARVLLMFDKMDRSRVASELISRANMADRFRKRLGRMHPNFGVGTLMSAAASYPIAPRSSRFAQDELRAIATVINSLLVNTRDQSL